MRAMMIVFLVGCVQTETDATEQAASASRILLPGGGTGQAHEVMTGFDQRLSVYVEDVHGDPVVGATVELVAPIDGATADISDGGVRATNINGWVSFAATAGPITGEYVVEARTERAAPLQFVLRNLPGAPAILLPASGASQSAMPDVQFQPLAVALQDQYGNPTPGLTVTFEAPAAGPTASLSATSAVVGSDGIASVTAIAGRLGGSYTVQAKAGDLVVDFELTNRTTPMPTSIGLDEMSLYAP
jgi:hypothetical protein